MNFISDLSLVYFDGFSFKIFLKCIGFEIMLWFVVRLIVGCFNLVM